MAADVSLTITEHTPPERVRQFLLRQGWYSTAGGRYSCSRYEYGGIEPVTWSEALCLEMMDFLEGMKK